MATTREKMGELAWHASTASESLRDVDKLLSAMRARIKAVNGIKSECERGHELDDDLLARLESSWLAEDMTKEVQDAATWCEYWLRALIEGEKDSLKMESGSHCARDPHGNSTLKRIWDTSTNSVAMTWRRSTDNLRNLKHHAERLRALLLVWGLGKNADEADAEQE